MKTNIELELDEYCEEIRQEAKKQGKEVSKIIYNMDEEGFEILEIRYVKPAKKFTTEERTMLNSFLASLKQDKSLIL